MVRQTPALLHRVAFPLEAGAPCLEIILLFCALLSRCLLLCRCLLLLRLPFALPPGGHCTCSGPDSGAFSRLAVKRPYRRTGHGTPGGTFGPRARLCPCRLLLPPAAQGPVPPPWGRIRSALLPSCGIHTHPSSADRPIAPFAGIHTAVEPWRPERPAKRQARWPEEPRMFFYS